MDATWIIMVFVIVDAIIGCLDPQSHVLAEVPDAKIITIAVVATSYFQNHRERVVCIIQELGYLSRPISVSCCNHRSRWVLPLGHSVLLQLPGLGSNRFEIVLIHGDMRCTGRPWRPVWR